MRGACVFPLFTFHWSGAHIFEQIWRHLVTKFQLEGFFLLLTVSSNREPVSLRFHLPWDSPESKATFVSQPINKEVGARK